MASEALRNEVEACASLCDWEHDGDRIALDFTPKALQVSTVIKTGEADYEGNVDGKFIKVRKEFNPLQLKLVLAQFDKYVLLHNQDNAMVFSDGELSVVLQALKV